MNVRLQVEQHRPEPSKARLAPASTDGPPKRESSGAASLVGCSSSLGCRTDSPDEEDPPSSSTEASPSASSDTGGDAVRKRRQEVDSPSAWDTRGKSARAASEIGPATFVLPGPVKAGACARSKEEERGPYTARGRVGGWNVHVPSSSAD
eukprot:CAMPEP_0168461134 /NCGR_PEP_ID=MMETSP0228-20121227/53817_1 /TAXON_ID=133427 /ORGANISM="Protoceratium reticulatum, Strain CCCM 535 (=CCMP 1889)" /LENGTH=149 /DNA_ID=CAMNT_0008476417 /DNA_START=307 /DNA_END=754 /DNA_ORIENTATION=+